MKINHRLEAFHKRVDEVMAEEQQAVNRFFDAARAHQLSQTSGHIVVYIEDDPDQVSMFKTMMACYSTLTVIPALSAEDGKTTIRQRSRRLKCVVMDISLSGDAAGVDEGMSLLSWIKSEYPDVPVVVLTSHVELVADLSNKYPDIDVHVKAKANLEKVVNSITTAHKRIGVA